MRYSVDALILAGLYVAGLFVVWATFAEPLSAFDQAHGLLTNVLAR